MISNNPSSNLSNITHSTVDHAAAAADGAIKATQRAGNEALDSLSTGVHELRDQVAPLLNRTTEQIGALAQRGANTVRESTQQLRDRALRATDGTVDYVKHEPVKAMLIAAATGAALMALLSLITRSRRV